MDEQKNPRREHLNADETYRDEHPTESVWLTVIRSIFATIAASFLGWESAQNILRKRGDITAFGSIIAHAHTLDKLHGRTPVDPLVQVFRSLPLNSDAGCDKLTDAERHVVATAARKTLAALRRGMELVPTPRMPTEAETREAFARYCEDRGWPGDAANVRAGNLPVTTRAFHTTITEMLEQINEREQHS